MEKYCAFALRKHIVCKCHEILQTKKRRLLCLRRSISWCSLLLGCAMTACHSFSVYAAVEVLADTFSNEVAFSISMDLQATL